MLALLLCALVCSSMGDEAWETFKAEHGKVYTEDEEAIRYAVWKENVDDIEEHNSQNGETFVQGTNEYSDMTHEEFQAALGYCYKPTEEGLAAMEENSGEFVVDENYEAASQVDWRQQGYVTSVKNQGQCGSCYSFSANGALEAQWFKKTGQLISLSESQIVDCDNIDQGCSGGLMNQVWDYARSAGGVESESAYPYHPYKGWCQFNRWSVVAKVAGYNRIPQDEEALKQAVARVGPVSIAIDAGQRSLQHYRYGVYNDPWCSQSQLNHAVLIVGYGVESGQPYWLIKNSWGASWGAAGYFKMARGVNMCGVAVNTMYPIAG